MQPTRLFKQAYFTSNPLKRGKPIKVQQSLRKQPRQKVQLIPLIRIQQQKSSITINEETRSLTNETNDEHSKRNFQRALQNAPFNTERIQKEQKESNALKQKIRELQQRLMEKEKENSELKQKIEGQKTELEQKIQKSFQTKIMLQYMQQIQSFEHKRLKKSQSLQNDDGQSQSQLSSKSLILANMQEMKELYIKITQLETSKQKLLQSTCEQNQMNLQDLINEYNQLTNQVQTSNQNIFIQVINNKIKLSQLLKRVNFSQ